MKQVIGALALVLAGTFATPAFAVEEGSWTIMPAQED